MYDSEKILRHNKKRHKTDLRLSRPHIAMARSAETQRIK